MPSGSRIFANTESIALLDQGDRCFAQKMQSNGEGLLANNVTGTLGVGSLLAHFRSSKPPLLSREMS